jgi:hypothetical protein
MSKSTQSILTFAIYCIAVFSVLNTFSTLTGIEGRYGVNFLPFSFILLVFCFVTVYLFWSDIAAWLRCNVYSTSLGVAVVTFLVAILFYQYPVIFSIESPHAGEGLALSPYTYFLPKILDIVLQQLCLLVAVLKIKHCAQSYTFYACVAVIFFVMHFTLFFEHSVWFVLATIVGSSIGGGIFILNFLKYKYGFIYNYSIHWLFYIALALVR